MDIFFQPLFAFVLIELASRCVIHVGVTRSPTDAWVTQQLREATPFGQTATYVIRDHHSTFGADVATIAAGGRMKVLRTPYQAPRANGICECFLGSVRHECLDHLLILSEAHLQHVLQEYVAYYNWARPHQGIAQRIPEPAKLEKLPSNNRGRVITMPVLGICITHISG